MYLSIDQSDQVKLRRKGRSVAQGALVVFLLFGAFVAQAFAQTAATTCRSNQNLRDCVDGFETCDHSLLTNTQAGQIADLQRDQNLCV